MNDPYDKLSVSPDPSLAEELRQRLHVRLEQSSLDDAGSNRRPTIASPEPGDEFEPMEEMHMSDVDSPDREHTNRWRTPALAAAAIVVLGVGAIALAVSNTNADDDDAVSQAPTPTAAPTTTAAPRTGNVLVVGPQGNVKVTYTLPDGWNSESSGFLVVGESSVVNFWDVRNVYADGCEWTLLDPKLGPTVDDLAEVWATLPGFTATAPVDITVDGYAGKRVNYTVPDYDEADCAQGKFALWTESAGGTGPNFWAQVPMQQNRQWIIDVDGSRLVINEWSEPGTTPEQLADMDQLLASIQIG